MQERCQTLEEFPLLIHQILWRVRADLIRAEEEKLSSPSEKSQEPVAHE